MPILMAIAAHGQLMPLGVILLFVAGAQLLRHDSKVAKALAIIMFGLGGLGAALFIIAIPYIGTGGG